MLVIQSGVNMTQWLNEFWDSVRKNTEGSRDEALPSHVPHIGCQSNHRSPWVPLKPHIITLGVRQTTHYPGYQSNHTLSPWMPLKPHITLEVRQTTHHHGCQSNHTSHLVPVKPHITLGTSQTIHHTWYQSNHTSHLVPVKPYITLCARQTGTS